jgi:photosystem II stability/assembly factor-like uncharacterized protein
MMIKRSLVLATVLGLGFLLSSSGANEEVADVEDASNEDEVAGEELPLSTAEGPARAKTRGWLTQLGPGVESLGPTRFAGRVRAIVIRPDNLNVIWVAAATGGLWKSVNGGADWSQYDDFLPSLAFSSLTIDPQNPNVMYAGTGELYPYLFHLDRIPDAILSEIEGLDVRSPYRGAGILKTTDGGATWSVLNFTANNNADFHYVNRIAVSPADSNIVLAGTNTGLWRSSDGGVNWIKENEVAGRVLDVKFHPRSLPSALASTHSGNIYYSASVGAQNNWFVSNLPADLPTASNRGTRVELAASPSEPGVWLAAYLLENGGNTTFNLLRSSDRGANFGYLNGQSSTITCDGTNLTNNVLYTGALWVDPQNPSKIVLAGIRLCRSVDGGINFTRIGRAPDQAHFDFHAIVQSPAPGSRTIYVGNDGGVARVENYDSTAGTTNLNVNLVNQQIHGAAKNPLSGVVIAGTQDIGTLRRANTGTWTPLIGGGAPGDDAMMVATDPIDSNYWYYGTSQGRVSRSTDGGQTDGGQIFNCSPPNIVEGLCTGPAPILLDPFAPNTIYIGCSQLFRTRHAKDPKDPPDPDGSCNGPSIVWDAIKPQSPSGNDTHLITTMAMPPYDRNVMWVGTLKSRVDVDGNARGVDPHERELWMTTILQGLADGAVNAGNWTNMSDGSGLPQRPIARIAIRPTAPTPTNPMTVYVAFRGWAPNGSQNLWKGTQQSNGTFSWKDISAGLPGLPPGPLFSVAVHPTVAKWIYAGTNFGIYRSTDDGQTWSATLDGRVPRVPVSDLSWVGNTARLTVSTYGRGVLELDETSNPERVIPEGVSYTKGQISNGHIENLAVGDVDDRYLVSSPTAGGVTMEVMGRSGFERTAPLAKGASLIFQLESSAIKPLNAKIAPTLKIELFNFTSGTYKQVFSGTAPTTEQLISKSGGGSPRDFIGTSRELRARLTWVGVSSSGIDFARWVIGR